MIAKLRRKFVLINMLLVTLVLLAVFGALCFSNDQRLRGETLDALMRTLDDRAELSSKPELGKPGGRLPGLSIPTFCVTLGEDGSILRVSQGNVTVTDEVAAQAVEAALAADDREGVIGALGLRYLRADTPEGDKLAFADLRHETDGMRSLILNSLAVGAVGLLAFFGISLFLSRLALRPAERAWEQQRRFVADASHELKTPLTVILANVGVLLSHPDDTIGQQRQWAENTREEAVRMKGLVDDLLFLARADADRAPPVLTAVSLSDVVWGGLLSFEPVAFEQGVEISSEIAPGLTVKGNEGQLRQLCVILLDNAVKYAGAHGSVAVTLERRGGRALLCVRNSGAVIPADDLPHVFDRFYRVDPSRAQGGYGLGLAIARQIVEAHAGKIVAASSEREGTVFSVTL